MRSNDFMIGFFIFIGGLVSLYYAKSLPKIRGTDYGPGSFLGLISFLLIIFGIKLAFDAYRSSKKDKTYIFPKLNFNIRSVFDFLIIPICCAFYATASSTLGFPLVSFLIIFLLVFYLHKKLLAATLTGITVTLALWLGFVKLLNVPLDMGFFL